METAKEAIISAAMKGVRLYGLHGVRIRHISDIAGILPSSIYGYFKGKDDLMQACFTVNDGCLASVMETAVQGTCSGDEKTEKLRRFWNSLYHWLIQHEDETVFFHRYCDRPGSFLSEIQNSKSFRTYIFAMQQLGDETGDHMLLWLHGFLGTVRYAKYVIDGVLPNNSQTERNIFSLLFRL